MALSANTVWEIRAAGDDANGGGFVTGASGSDWSQQNGKRTGADVTDISTTDAVCNGTTTVTSATANFAATIVGNIICMSGGTGGLTKQWYQVTARTNATTITVDRTIIAGTGVTMNIGGALASLGMAGGVVLVAGMIIWVRAGTYTVTSASINVSGGCFSSSTAVFIEGYNTVRGDLGTKPLIQADGVITAFTLITQGSNGSQYVKNLKLDGNNRTTSRGLVIRGYAYYIECVNFTNSGIADTVGTTAATAFNCSATGCSTQAAFSIASCINCVAFNNTVSGFANGGTDAYYVRCLAYGNSGASSDGFNVGASSGKGTFINCVAYNNGRDGFRLGGQRSQTCINCIAEANAGVGFNHALNQQLGLFVCAGFNNTGGNSAIGTHAASFNTGFITGGASFFTNAAGADFSLNNTAGAGAVVRDVGMPGQITGHTTSTGYLDLGVFQHQGAGGGGGAHSAVF